MKRVLILANNDVGLYKFRKELIMELLKDNKVFRSVSSNLASAGNREISGYEIPFSHLFTAGVVTPKYLATCS